MLKVGARRASDDCTLVEECQVGGEMVTVWSNPNGCHENGMCVAKDGAYQCQCRPGYRGDGVNECDGKLKILFKMSFF